MGGLFPVPVLFDKCDKFERFEKFEKKLKYLKYLRNLRTFENLTNLTNFDMALYSLDKCEFALEPSVLFWL